MPISTTATARSPLMSPVSLTRMMTARPTRITPDPPSGLAGSRPALHDRIGLALTRDQQPARYVKEGAQPSGEAEHGEGDPDYPDGHFEAEAQTGRYPG